MQSSFPCSGVFSFCLIFLSLCTRDLGRWPRDTRVRAAHPCNQTARLSPFRVHSLEGNPQVKATRVVKRPPEKRPGSPTGAHEGWFCSQMLVPPRDGSRSACPSGARLGPFAASIRGIESVQRSCGLRGRDWGCGAPCLLPPAARLSTGLQAENVSRPIVRVVGGRWCWEPPIVHKAPQKPSVWQKPSRRTSCPCRVFRCGRGTTRGEPGASRSPWAPKSMAAALLFASGERKSIRRMKAGPGGKLGPVSTGGGLHQLWAWEGQVFRRHRRMAAREEGGQALASIGHPGTPRRPGRTSSRVPVAMESSSDQTSVGFPGTPHRRVRLLVLSSSPFLLCVSYIICPSGTDMWEAREGVLLSNPRPSWRSL